MVHTFMSAAKELGEHLTVELLIVEDPSKSKYWKETEQIEKAKNNKLPN